MDHPLAEKMMKPMASGSGEPELAELPDWDVNPHCQVSSTAHLALRNHVENMFTKCKQENIHLPSELCHNLLKQTSSMPPIRIGFVGETGVGKSTIIDRLLGVNLLKSPAFGFGKHTPSSKMIVELLPHADIDRQDYLFDFVTVPMDTIREWHEKAKADAQYWRANPNEEAPAFLKWFLRCFTHEDTHTYKPSPSYAFEDHYTEELPKYQEFLQFYSRDSSSFTKVTADLYQTVFEDVKRFSSFIQQVSVFGPFHLLRALHVTLVDIPGMGFGIPPMAGGEGSSWLMEERAHLAARMCQDIFFVADHRMMSSTATERTLLSLSMKCRNLYLIRTHAGSMIHHMKGQAQQQGQKQGQGQGMMQGQGGQEQVNKYGPDALNHKLMDDLRHLHHSKGDVPVAGSSEAEHLPFSSPSMQILLNRIGSRVFAIENMEGDPTEGEEYDKRFNPYWEHFVDSLEIIYGNRYDRDLQRRVKELNCLMHMTRIPDSESGGGGDNRWIENRIREEERLLREVCDAMTMEYSPGGVGEMQWLPMCCSSTSSCCGAGAGSKAGAKGEGKQQMEPMLQQGQTEQGQQGGQQECMMPYHLLTANHEEFNRRIATACGHDHKMLQCWLTYTPNYWHGEWYNSKMQDLFEIVLSCLMPMEPAYASMFNQSIQQMIDYFVSKVIRPQLLTSMAPRSLRDDHNLQAFVLNRCKHRIVSDLLDCFQGVKFFFVNRVVPLLMKRYGQSLQEHLRKAGSGCKQEMLKGLRNWFSVESQSMISTVLPSCIQESLQIYFTEEVERFRDDCRTCLMQISLCLSLMTHKMSNKAKVNAIFEDVSVDHLNIDLTCCKLIETRSINLSPLFDEITSRCSSLIPLIESLKEQRRGPHGHGQSGMTMQCPVKYSPHHEHTTTGGRDRDREGIHLSGIEHCDMIFSQKPLHDVRVRCGRVERIHDKSIAFSVTGDSIQGGGGGGMTKTQQHLPAVCCDKQRVFASWSTVDATLVEGIVYHCLYSKSLSRTSDYFNCSVDVVQQLTECVVRFVDNHHGFASR